MSKAIIPLITILCLILLVGGWRKVEQPKPIVPVVLISIDGLKPDYVLEADKLGLKIPNLRRMAREGSYATGVTGVVPTFTYPSHATMVTGVSPAKHGILSNTPFDPLDKNNIGWYWYADDIRVPTLWETANQAGLTTASVDWPVSVNANVTYNIVQYWRAGNAEDLKLIRALSTKGLLVEAEAKLGTYPNGYDYSLAADGRRTRFINYLLETKRPNLLTCYLAALDTEQHGSGPYSPATFDQIEDVDRMIGEIRAAAERLGQGQAVICVVSDHGFIKTDKEIHLNLALKEAGLLEYDQQSKVKSWQAYGWYGGGVMAVMLHEPDNQAILTKTRAALQRLAQDPNSGIERVLEQPEISRLGGFPDAAFLVCAKPGYRFGRNRQGAIFTKGSPAGSHGHLPEMKEMNAAFFLTGPGVAARNLGQIDMRDIAPTLAGFLGVALPQAEGHNLMKKD